MFLDSSLSGFIPASSGVGFAFPSIMTFVSLSYIGEQWGTWVAHVADRG